MILNTAFIASGYWFIESKKTHRKREVRVQQFRRTLTSPSYKDYTVHR